MKVNIIFSIKKCSCCLAIVMILLALPLESAWSAPQLFPQHEIQIFVPAPAGGGTDVVTRMLAEVLKKSLRQPVIVVNKAGASGFLALHELVKSPADGYTLMLSASAAVTGKYVDKNCPSLKDFEVIAMINLDPSVVFVKPDSPYKSLKDFFDDAKHRPGVVSVGHGGVAGNYYFNAVCWQLVSGAKFRFVPFRGGAEIYPMVAGGHIEAGSGSFPDAQELLKAAKMKALGVASEKRDMNFPDVPTFLEQQYKLIAGTYRFLIAPKGVPEDILRKLENEVAKAMQTEDFKKFWKTSGYGEFYLDKVKSIEFLNEQDKITAEAYRSIRGEK